MYRKIQRSCNVLVIDEISMLDNRLKELIFDRFNMCKIIMCGDNGYQLDGFNSKGDSFHYVERSRANASTRRKDLFLSFNSRKAFSII